MTGTWERVRDGHWEDEHGNTINKVNPRGKVLYARRLAGSRRPTWHDTLEEAKRRAP